MIEQKQQKVEEKEVCHLQLCAVMPGAYVWVAERKYVSYPRVDIRGFEPSSAFRTPWLRRKLFLLPLEALGRRAEAWPELQSALGPFEAAVCAAYTHMFEASILQCKSCACHLYFDCCSNADAYSNDAPFLARRTRIANSRHV